MKAEHRDILHFLLYFMNKNDFRVGFFSYRIVKVLNLFLQSYHR